MFQEVDRAGARQVLVDLDAFCRLYDAPAKRIRIDYQIRLWLQEGRDVVGVRGDRPICCWGVREEDALLVSRPAHPPDRASADTDPVILGSRPRGAPRARRGLAPALRAPLRCR